MTLKKPLFWQHQFHGLRSWGQSWLRARKIASFKKSRYWIKSELCSESQSLVIFLPGIGGSFSQFFSLMQTLSEHTSADVLYLQPRWGKTLKEQAVELEDWIKKNLPLYESYIAIGHSRGGLLARALLDQPLFASHHRHLISLATPWRFPDAHSKSLRFFLYHQKRYRYLARLARWSLDAAEEIFRSYDLPPYQTTCLASLYDPIVGPPYYQSLEGATSVNFASSHLSLPLEKNVHHYLIELIKQESKTDAFEKF